MELKPTGKRKEDDQGIHAEIEQKNNMELLEEEWRSSIMQKLVCKELNLCNLVGTVWGGGSPCTCTSLSCQVVTTYNEVASTMTTK